MITSLLLAANVIAWGFVVFCLLVVIVRLADNSR